MDTSMQKWHCNRLRLEDQLIDIALKLQRHLGCENFDLPVKEAPFQIRLMHTAPPVEKLEVEIAALAAKLYALKNETVVQIPASEADAELVITIARNVTA